MSNDYVRATFTYEGKRYYVKAKNEIELGAKLAERKKQLEKGFKLDGGNTKLSPWIDEWLAVYKEPTVSYTWYKDMQAFTRLIKEELGFMKIGQVKTVHIQKLLNGQQHKSRSTVKKLYDILRDIFGKAVDNRLIAFNPVTGAQIPLCKPPKTRRALTPEEAQVFLKAADSHKHGLFVKIIYYCGLRPGEVSALKWENVDIKKKTITVTSAIKKDGTIGPPKSRAGYRTVPIPEALLPELKRGIGYVCPRDSGQHHNRTSLKDLWNSLTREMDILMGAKLYRNQIVESKLADDLTMYCLRHTYCTNLQAAGVPINVARELMGHADITTTAKIYTHFSEESFNTAAASINAFHGAKNTDCANECAKSLAIPSK